MKKPLFLIPPMIPRIYPRGDPYHAEWGECMAWGRTPPEAIWNVVVYRLLHRRAHWLFDKVVRW